MKDQYLRTLVCGEALRPFHLLSYNVESANPLIVEYIILGLGADFPPVNFLSKKKCMIFRITRKY